MEPFIDSVVALDKADTEARRTEFKRFVNEFGTHYASTTEMGTRDLMIGDILPRQISNCYELHKSVKPIQ